jgi:photosystem II stability/assembly factor-like uncharacterized protein
MHTENAPTGHLPPNSLGDRLALRCCSPKILTEGLRRGKESGRKLVASASLIIMLCPLSQAQIIQHPTSQFGMIWQAFKIGAGGFMTDIAIAADGTKIAKTDTYGLYYLDPASGLWQQIVTQSSMPTVDANMAIEQSTAAFEMAIAPNNTSRFYMMFNGLIYRTDNHGASWTKTAFTRVNADANDNTTKVFGPYIAVDPVNPDRVYVSTPSNGLFFTKDAGASWSRVSSIVPAIAPSSSTTSSSNVAMGTGSKTFTTSANLGLGVGTQVQVWETDNVANQMLGTVTSDSGATLILNILFTNGTGTHSDWTIATAQGGGHLIFFDPTSSISDGEAQDIFVSSYGTGVYHSTDGGSTWSLLASSGMPTTHTHMFADQTGILWLVANDNKAGATGGSLNKFANGSWSQPLRSGIQSVAVNPANANNVYGGQNDGKLMVSTNGGLSFVGPTNIARRANDIPWLAWTNESFMSNGNMVFDPSASNLLYFAEGIGIWTTNPPTANKTVIWTSNAASIENMVSQWAVSPPGGSPVFAFWDRPFFYGANTDAYPSTHGVTNANAIQLGSSVDWASSLPSTIVGIANSSQFGTFNATDTSGYSSDGGRTWKRFASIPKDVLDDGRFGGSIAASTPTNFVWCESNGGNAYYTTNGGLSWTRISIPEVKSSGWGGFAFFLDRQIVAADRVTPNTFYIYVNDTGRGSDGVYKSMDGGATWNKQSNPKFKGPTAFNSILRSVPGQAGHLFFSAGPASGPHPANQPFYRSIDGGATWHTLFRVNEVWCFGFGAPKPDGKGYPAIFIYGWVGGILGVWRSDDSGNTWTQISDRFPQGIFSHVKVVEGDNNTFGRVYVGFVGASYASGKSN